MIKAKFRRVFRFALRSALHKKEVHLRPPVERDHQIQRFVGKVQKQVDPLVCVIGSDREGPPGTKMRIRHGDFEIAGDNNVLDILNKEGIDLFYLNRSSSRDLVNLVNFLSVYRLDIPILMGKQFKCHSLVGYVPVMPNTAVTTGISVHNYFAKNYRISDTLFYQGYLYQGRTLVDCHQFFLQPDETKVMDLKQELEMGGLEAGVYYLEVSHPQLPTSTIEHRYFGLYHDESSDYGGGTHSMPLKSWNHFGLDGRTLTRTFIPNINGTSARYLIPGASAQREGSKVATKSTLENEVELTPSKARGSLETRIENGSPQDTSASLAFDRISTVPIEGGQGFQTLWIDGRGLAVWHDGGSVREVRKKVQVYSALTNKTAKKKDEGERSPIGRLFEERQESSQVSGNLIDLYQKKAKYFLAVFPFLGHSHPDLNVVFDSEQWAENIVNFDIRLFTNNGVLIDEKPFHFDGTLQTLNLNSKFGDQPAELTQGYWTITADPKKQNAPQDLNEFQYPSDSMLFAFWSDGENMYDSVHSLTSKNTVAFDLLRGSGSQSEMSKATKRVVSRTKKFAPFVTTEDQKSWYWLCNVGISEEKIDTTVRIRLHGPDNLEAVTPFTLPSNHSTIVSADQILDDLKVRCPRGTIWVESNDCNIGALWFLQSRENTGFAVDHFTGG